MTHDFWQSRWQQGEIGFHAASVQPALIKHWPSLGVAQGARVFVPLAGKSLDLHWLAERGYTIVGVELSPIAVADFFAEAKIDNVAITNDGPFSVHRAGPFEIWCGDYFALDPKTVNVTAAYDRAALVAMTPDMQPAYADKLGQIMPAASKVLLIGLDYDQSQMQGPPFSIPSARITELLARNFTVDELGTHDGMAKSEHLRKRGLTRLEETTYALTRRN